MDLRGRRVAVTRPVEGAETLIGRLEAEGARVIVTPLIRIAPVRDQRAIGRAARNAERYDWIVFTSANAVNLFSGARAGALPSTVSIGVVGAATAAAVAAMGARVDLIPEPNNAEALAKALATRPIAGRRILWPRAVHARKGFARRLRAAGAEVDEIAVYRTEPDPAGARDLRARVERHAVDVITFASPSAVNSYAASGPVDVGGARVVVIGPVTANAARRVGLAVHARAAEPGVEGLIAAIRGLDA